MWMIMFQIPAVNNGEFHLAELNKTFSTIPFSSVRIKLKIYFCGIMQS